MKEKNIKLKLKLSEQAEKSHSKCVKVFTIHCLGRSIQNSKINAHGET
jgi:hypothetical protein